MLKVLLDTSPLGNENSIRGVGVYTRQLRTHLSTLRDVSLVNELKSDVDVIHYPYFDLFFSTLPLLKSKPTVVTVHDVIPLLFPEYYQPGLKGWLRFKRQQLALKRIDAVITDSEASKRDIQLHLGIPETKIFVTYLAANPNLHKPTPSEFEVVKELYHLPAQYVLYVGDINYNKNIPQLIKALKFLPPELHLVCVGKNFKPQPIPEWHWIEAQIAMSEVTNRVQFLPELGEHADSELSALYSGAVAYVQPSLYEGFGLPVLEAMQCQTPVVAAHNSSLIEVGGDVVEFSEPQAEALAEHIRVIMKLSNSKREHLIKTAFEWSQKFTWRKTALKTKEVYEAVLST